MLKQKSKRKQERKGKDNKKKKALSESDDETDKTLNNGKEDIMEGEVAEKVKNVAAKKAKSLQISKVNAGNVKAVTKRRNAEQGFVDHGGKNRRKEKVFQNEKQETSSTRKPKRNRRREEKKEVATTKSQNNGAKMKQTLKRRKYDHSVTEETSSNIHAIVSSKENTDENDKTTKTDAILDNNNSDGLINGEKGLNACRSETEAVLDVIPNEAEEVSESVVSTHNENGGGDDLDSSLSGEKNIHTPEGSVNDVIEENHDRLNKGEKRVNTFSSETECV